MGGGWPMRLGVAVATGFQALRRAFHINYEPSRGIFGERGWELGLQCCGVDGPRGWLTVFPTNNVPGSCCREPPASANAFCRNTLDDTVIFQDGCYQKLKNKVKDNIVLIMGVGIGVAFIEVSYIMCFLM
ncbi:hypothetical protein LSTR_LSTR002786 [Laodelphax striatellus]|uniref:Tetraspanin n=1 Tax=Laodelphax striatellus TaxID=195883 RepID=A0A482XHQ0_LAOST|nr:hypothetical protein LSTR_LSTR002786 [Laodelphax striatellus]